MMASAEQVVQDKSHLVEKEVDQAEVVASALPEVVQKVALE